MTLELLDCLTMCALQSSMHCWCKLHLRAIIHAHALFYVSEVAGCNCKSVVNTELTQTKTTSFNINTSSSCISFSYLSRQSLVSHLNKKASISCAYKLSEIGVFVHACLHACGYAKVSHAGTTRAIGPLNKWAMWMGSVGEEGLQAGYTQKKKKEKKWSSMTWQSRVPRTQS